MKQLIRKIALLILIVMVVGNAVDAQRHYGHRGYYAPPRYAFGPRYSYIPRSSISITFGGLPYYYSQGMYYRPYGGLYAPVFPPVGIRIGLLPPGYIPIMVGPNPYYFYNGVYYRRYDDRSYQVVDAPMGAQLSALPKGAKAVSVNGEQFYELNGTYYKEDRDAKGRTVYTVTGKDGKINNSGAADEQLQQSPSAQPSPSVQPLQGPQGNMQLRVGDKVDQIPQNCKTITLNGQKTFIAPDNTYYQQQSDGTYTVVGVEGQ